MQSQIGVKNITFPQLLLRTVMKQGYTKEPRTSPPYNDVTTEPDDQYPGRGLTTEPNVKNIVIGVVVSVVILIIIGVAVYVYWRCKVRSL